jgi:hypothetical protein
MYESKPNPRREYREQERQRLEASATLAETFRALKSLTVDLAYFNQGSFMRNSQIKYTVNLAHAKARFCITCPNDRCVGGDFDLSAELAKAVAARRTTVSGELICQGWRSHAGIGEERCNNVLRYRLSAKYVRDTPPAEREEAAAHKGNGA